MHNKFKILFCCIALFPSWDSVHASMCWSPQPKENTIDHADIIFRGSLVAIEPASGLMGKFKLKFEVVETFRGIETSSWTVIWNHGSTGISKNLLDDKRKIGEDFVVALVLVDHLVNKQGTRVPAPGVDLGILDSMDRDSQHLPWVLSEGPCSPPVMGSFIRMEPLLKRRNIIK